MPIILLIRINVIIFVIIIIFYIFVFVNRLDIINRLYNNKN